MRRAALDPHAPGRGQADWAWLLMHPARGETEERRMARLVAVGEERTARIRADAKAAQAERAGMPAEGSQTP